MSVIRKIRKQKAIWWRRVGVDHYGRPQYAGPVQVDCRWEDDAREFVMENGEKFISRSIVYVDRPMSVGDRIALGVLGPTTPSDPYDSDKAYEIRRFSIIPNLRNTQVLYKAIL